MDKNIHNPPNNKSHKHFFMTQSLLRVLAIGTTLAAGIVMFNNDQSVILYGIEFDARYSYSPAFRFFAFANIASSVVSSATLVVSLIYGLKAVGSLYYYFYLFVHDLGVSVLLASACAATMAIAYVGKYGNTHTGWTPICDHFGTFCNKVITSAVLSYLGLISSFVLTISSVNKIRRVQAA